MTASDLETSAAPPPGAPARPGTVGSELRWRILSLLNVYRLLASALLLALFWLSGTPPVVGDELPQLFIVCALAYFVLSVLGFLLARQRQPPFLVQMSVELAVDIGIVVGLMNSSGGIGSGIGNLLVVSAAAAALTLTPRLALLFAASATLAVLAEQALRHFYNAGSAADYAAAGVLGGITFAIAIAARPLTRRIRETEALAEQRGVDLANLAELNEYIIQHLRESIVVVDSDDRVRLLNESAANHLALKGTSRGKLLQEISPRLAELTTSWRTDADHSTTAVSSFVSTDGSTVITPHFAPIGAGRPAATLIFLEDSSQIAERVQQGKLAALGRLSASIAHEIRNPVGAISHAGQLLAESAGIGADERRLTDIVHANCTRVSKIIDNVLQLSRQERIQPQQILLLDWLAGFVAEFRASLQLPEGRVVVSAAQPQLSVRMDPSHLQQVLWNLCENALRHACPAPSDRIELHIGRLRANGRPYLEVLDRGPGIHDSQLDRVFEPFFTGASDGTGLGLFIARELCDYNRANLQYEPRERGGSCFRIIFADPDRWTV